MLSNTSRTKKKIYTFRLWVSHFIRPCNWDGGSACLCHAITAAAQMEAKRGLEKQRTEFSPRNITLRCQYKHRANPSQIVSKNIPEGSCLICRREGGGRLETPAGITVVPKGPFILELFFQETSTGSLQKTKSVIPRELFTR